MEIHGVSLFSRIDQSILKKLAKEVHEIAADPINELKRSLWRKHNSLQGERPVIFVHPDGAWQELLPASSLQCEGDWARQIESILRQRIIRHLVIQDDVPIEKSLFIEKSYIAINKGWGLVPERVFSNSERGAWQYKPVIKKPEDWKKLRKPMLDIDEESTNERYSQTQELLGSILDINLCGIKSFSFHMMHLYCDLRGLENMMLDLILEPDMVHEVMSFITEGFQGLINQCVQNNLVSLNNDGTFHYTGGVGYIDELPRENFDANNVKLRDIWGAAEAQEFAQVSPEMHEEFVLQYERKLLAPFGLNGYGCCDDLTKKMDGVLKIPNLRRISICPWADIGACADRLKKNYIMSWKPQPSYFAMDPFDSVFIENYLLEQLEKAKKGYVEIVLRDTHTCKNQPQRFTEFVRIARKVIGHVYR